MATYNAYPGVRKLQEYLEAHKAAVGFEKSLRDDDGSFDGKYGSDTDEAFWAWMAKLPEGSDLSSLVPHVLSAADVAQVAKAQAEFNAQAAKPEPEPEPKPGTDIPYVEPKKAGLGTVAWVLIGAGVVIAGGLGFYFLTRQPKTPRSMPAHSMPSRSPRGRRSFAPAGLGCGCGR